MRDRTEQHAADEVVRQSEERLRLLVTSVVGLMDSLNFVTNMVVVIKGEIGKDNETLNILPLRFLL